MKCRHRPKAVLIEAAGLGDGPWHEADADDVPPLSVDETAISGNSPGPCRGCFPVIEPYLAGPMLWLWPFAPTRGTAGAPFSCRTA
jgi:hypothetical protein